MSEPIRTTFTGQNRTLLLDGNEAARSIASKAELQLQSLSRRFATIDSDDTLSAKGIADQRQNAAVSHLSSFDGLLDQVDSIKSDIESKQNRLAGSALAPRDPGDAAGAMIDLEIARILRGTEDKASLMTRIRSDALDEDATRVAGVYPELVTGFSSEQRQEARNSRIRQVDPVAAQSLEDDYASAQAAHDALKTAYRMIAEHVGDIGERKQAAPAAYDQFDSHAELMAGVHNPVAA